MSQLTSQIQVPSWTSLSIVKFSHNTCPFGTRNFTWTHTNRNDLHFVLQEVRVVDGLGRQRAGVLMKITAGAEVLESQELGELIDIHRAYSPAVDGERPVEVVTRSPFLAIRYPKTGNIIQRIQVRFRTAEGFDQALQALSGLGLPVSDRSTCPSAISNPVPLVHQSDGRRSPTISTAFRAGTSYESGNLNADTNKSHPLSTTPSLLSQRPSSSLTEYGASQFPTLRVSSGIASHHFSHSSPLKEMFKIPARPASSVSDVAGPSSASSSNSLPITSTFLMGRRESSPVSQRQLPSIYLSQMQNEAGRRAPSCQTSNKFDFDSEAHTLASQNMTSQIQHLREGISQQTHQSHELSRLLTASLHFPPHQGALMTLGLSTEDPFSDSPPPNRDLIQLYDDMIPPKRELPFKRPKSSGNLISTTPILPPLPEPTRVSNCPSTKKIDLDKQMANPAQRNTTTPKYDATKKRVAQRKSSIKPKVADRQDATASAPVEETTTKSNNPIIQEDISPLAAKSASVLALSRPASVPVGLVSKAAPPPKKRAAPTPRPSSAEKRAKMVDQGTQTHTFRDQPAPKAMPNLVVPEQVETTPSPASPPESYMAAVDTFVTRYKDRLAPVSPVKPVEIWESPGYTEMTEDQRLDLVNDFLCRSLEDAHFIKMCEDMEHSWRRIGFM